MGGRTSLPITSAAAFGGGALSVHGTGTAVPIAARCWAQLQRKGRAALCPHSSARWRSSGASIIPSEKGWPFAEDSDAEERGGQAAGQKRREKVIPFGLVTGSSN